MNRHGLEKKLLMYFVYRCQDQFFCGIMSKNLVVVVVNQTLLETQSTVQVFPAVSVCDGTEGNMGTMRKRRMRENRKRQG